MTSLGLFVFYNEFIIASDKNGALDVCSVSEHRHSTEIVYVDKFVAFFCFPRFIFLSFFIKKKAKLNVLNKFVSHRPQCEDEAILLS